MQTIPSTHLLVCLGKTDPNTLYHGPREAHRAGITSEARSQVHTADTWVAGMVFALERKKNSWSLTTQRKHPPISHLSVHAY